MSPKPFSVYKCEIIKEVKMGIARSVERFSRKVENGDYLADFNHMV